MDISGVRVKGWCVSQNTDIDADDLLCELELMPIPKPNPGETEGAFIGRCMGNPTMHAEFPNQSQRTGVCSAAFRRKRGTEESFSLCASCGKSIPLKEYRVQVKYWIYEATCPSCNHKNTRMTVVGDDDV